MFVVVGRVGVLPGVGRRYSRSSPGAEVGAGGAGGIGRPRGRRRRSELLPKPARE